MLSVIFITELLRATSSIGPLDTKVSCPISIIASYSGTSEIPTQSIDDAPELWHEYEIVICMTRPETF